MRTKEKRNGFQLKGACILILHQNRIYQSTPFHGKQLSGLLGRRTQAIFHFFVFLCFGNFWLAQDMRQDDRNRSIAIALVYNSITYNLQKQKSNESRRLVGWSEERRHATQCASLDPKPLLFFGLLLHPSSHLSTQYPMNVNCDWEWSALRAEHRECMCPRHVRSPGHCHVPLLPLLALLFGVLAYPATLSIQKTFYILYIFSAPIIPFPSHAHASLPLPNVSLNSHLLLLRYQCLV